MFLNCLKNCKNNHSVQKIKSAFLFLSYRKNLVLYSYLKCAYSIIEMQKRKIFEPKKAFPIPKYVFYVEESGSKKNCQNK